MRKTHLTILLFLIFFFKKVISQDTTTLFFETISVEDGLSHVLVNCIVQDKQGFLWFGTENGLNKYDGYNFKIYKTKPNDTASLHSNSIKSIITTPKGQIWVGTSGGGLHLYNPIEDNFYNFLNIIPKTEIYCLMYDEYDNIWVGSYGKGISIINTKTLTSKEFRYNNKLSNKNIRALFKDSQGIIWIGTDGGGTYRYNQKDSTILNFIPQSDNNSIAGISIMSIVETDNRYIWFGTYGNGLSRLDKTDGTFKNYSTDNILSHNIIWKITKDNNNRLLLSTRGGGIDILNTKKEEVINLSSKHANPNKEINNNFILDILRDRSNVYWIATEQKGINKLDLNRIKFHTIPYFEKHKYNVTSIVSDEKENIWYGTAGNGIIYYDNSTGQYFQIQHEAKAKNTLSSNFILSIDLDSKGNLWIGTDGFGVDVLNIDSGTIRNYSETTTQIKLTNNAVHKVKVDSRNRVWLGTYGGGLMMFDISKDTIETYTINKNKLQNVVRDIHEDFYRNIWIATPYDGLGIIDTINHSIKYYKNKKFDPNSLSSNNVTCISQTSDKNIIWVGTQGNGLCKFDTKSSTFKTYTQEEGLANDIIVSLASTNQTLWIGTLNGLSKMITQLDEFSNFNANDGLKTNTINTLTLHITKNGSIILGTAKGVNTFTPSKVLASHYSPPILITDLKMGNHSIKPKNEYDGTVIINKNVSYCDTFNFNYKHNLISFRFAALDYTDPSSIKYKYKLEGFDNKWIETSSDQRYISYAKLPHGIYKLKIQSTNSDGVWSKNIKTVILNVSPPFWLTRWFISTVIIFILASIYLSVKLKTRQLQKDKLNLELKVSERTKEINFQNEEIIKQTGKILLQQEEIIDKKEELEKKNQELEKLTIATRETENSIAILSKDGSIEWTNDSFNKTIIRNHKDLKNIPLTDKLSYSELKQNNQIDTFIKECIESKKPHIFKSSISNNNKTYWIQTSLTPIFSNSGIVERLVAIDTDITDLKHAEEENLKKSLQIKRQNYELEEHKLNLENIVHERTSKLQEALTRAKESDRLKTSFLTNLSHEIRTPMNAIVGFADLLAMPSISESKKKKFSQLINKNSESLIRLIDDIIDLSKLETGQIVFEKSEFKVYNCMLRIYISQKEKIELQDKKIKLTHCTKDDLTETVIFSDSYRVEQVIVNLIDNAIKYTDKGEINYWFEKSVDKQNNKLIKFHVTDTGIGMRRDQLNSIFKSFAKIEENKLRLYRGTGLGLSISKNIVSLLGGQIGVDSEPEKGSHFYFTIPIEAIKNKFDKDKINWKGKTILVAEDEDINFLLINEALSFSKARIKRAYDGDEVINFWKENNPDVILMDIKMPNCDGISATKVIRESDKKIPIIAQTAFALLSEKEKIISKGFNDLITKPISHNTLINILHKYLGNNGEGENKIQSGD